MIPVLPPPEPPDFDYRTRQPGLAWLVRNQLADGFNNLCGYSAMLDRVGTVDHYLCCENRPDLAYEWANYRYASGWINASKGTLDDQVLDPFEIQEGWFEILLPSLQLVLTDLVPSQKRQKAEFTLKRLGLRDDEGIIRQRQQWYSMYLTNKITLDGLEEVAPLIARAVRKQAKED